MMAPASSTSRAGSKLFSTRATGPAAPPCTEFWGGSKPMPWNCSSRWTGAYFTFITTPRCQPIAAPCLLMEIVSNSGRPLSAQLADLPHTVTTPEIRFDCPDELKFEVVRRASAELRARHKTVDVDGVRVLFPHGWGLVRASNTQPVLV